MLQKQQCYKKYRVILIIGYMSYCQVGYILSTMYTVR